LIEHGKPLEVEEVDLAGPGPDEVRVELAFGGVNPVDTYMAQGKVAPDGPVPRTLGGEASGTFDGQTVLVAGGGLGAVRDGVWATAAVVPRSSVFPVPKGVGLPEAAVAGVVGLTAWNVLELAELETGDRVLVLGASGAVGLTVVSLAASSGATVWGQTSRAQKSAAVSDQGAERVVVSDASGLPDAVRDLAPTLVVDALGSDFTQAGLAALQPHGRLVIFGASAGHEGTIQLQALYRNGLRVLGYAGLRLSDDERRKGLEKTFGAIAEGRMHIRVDRTLPLEQVNEAFDLIAKRQVTGKIVLQLT